MKQQPETPADHQVWVREASRRVSDAVADVMMALETEFHEQYGARAAIRPVLIGALNSVGGYAAARFYDEQKQMAACAGLQAGLQDAMRALLTDPQGPPPSPDGDEPAGRIGRAYEVRVERAHRRSTPGRGPPARSSASGAGVEDAPDPESRAGAPLGSGGIPRAPKGLAIEETRPDQQGENPLVASTLRRLPVPFREGPASRGMRAKGLFHKTGKRFREARGSCPQHSHATVASPAEVVP